MHILHLCALVIKIYVDQYFFFYYKYGVIFDFDNYKLWTVKQIVIIITTLNNNRIPINFTTILSLEKMWKEPNNNMLLFKNISNNMTLQIRFLHNKFKWTKDLTQRTYTLKLIVSVYSDM